MKISTTHCISIISVGLTAFVLSCSNGNTEVSDTTDDTTSSTDGDSRGNWVDTHGTSNGEDSTKGGDTDTSKGSVTQDTEDVVYDTGTQTTDGTTDSYSDTGTKSDITGAYKLFEDNFTTESPSFVKMMFHVTNEDDVPLTTLTTEDFTVEEDSQPVSPTESAMRIRKQDEMPFTLYTVLMLDNSLSVGSNLAAIKEAAKTLILTADAASASDRDGDTENQQFLIYSFSDAPTLVTPTFDNDVAALTEAIDSIEIGYNSTNLYGAIIEGVSQWADTVSEEGISQGFLVLLTDGSDTQDSSSLEAALGTRREKKVITVGLGSEIEPEVLASLGNFGFYQIDDYSELAAQFVEIQTNMNKFADSIYWVEYLSPKRGEGNHRLSVTINGNTYTGGERHLVELFESDRFYSVHPGLYINDSVNHSSTITEVALDIWDPAKLVFNTYLSADGSFPKTPDYSLTAECTAPPTADTDTASDNDAGPASTSDTEVDPLLQIEQSDTNPSIFVLTSEAAPGTICVLTAKDTANGFTNTLTLTTKDDSHGTTYTK